MRKVTILYLPLSPSVNSLYNNVNRHGTRGKWRVPTKRYQEWKAKAYNAIQTQLEDDWNTIDTPCKLLITCERRNKRSDLSNHIKALEDILVATKVIEDDKLVSNINIHWASEINPPNELANLAHPLACVAVSELS